MGNRHNAKHEDQKTIPPFENRKRCLVGCHVQKFWDFFSLQKSDSNNLLRHATVVSVTPLEGHRPNEVFQQVGSTPQ
jgi:hypothetical protein